VRHLIQARHVLPSAIKCFFFVYEEHLGKYGLRVLKHVLVYPQPLAPSELKTGCDWTLDPHDRVIVTSEVVVDRDWCRTCAAAVDAESRRRHGHTPNPQEEILQPLTKEIL